MQLQCMIRQIITYSFGGSLAIPGLDIKGFVIEVITKLLVSHLAKRIEVLKKRPDFIFNSQAVRLILVLLNFLRYLGNFSSFAEIDNSFGSMWQKVRVTLLRVENIGQVHPWRKKGIILVTLHEIKQLPVTKNSIVAVFT